jgi:hypothetical protein
VESNTEYRPVGRKIAVAMLIAALAGCAELGVSNPIKQEPAGTFQAGQVVGGATKQMTVDVRPIGGFLPRPELLQPGGQGRAALVYLNPQISGYRKILLEPVSVLYGPESDLAGVPADQRQALANAFYSDLYNALKGHCQLVRRASSNTMRVKVALVDAKVPNATINTVATYAPYASTAYSVAAFAFNKGVGYFSGTASVEGFATDAVKGTLLWEAVDKRGGTTALVADTLDNWRDIRHAFEAWGVQVRGRLQEMGVCTAAS